MTGRVLQTESVPPLDGAPTISLSRLDPPTDRYRRFDPKVPPFPEDSIVLHDFGLSAHLDSTWPPRIHGGHVVNHDRNSGIAASDVPVPPSLWGRFPDCGSPSRSTSRRTRTPRARPGVPFGGRCNSCKPLRLQVVHFSFGEQCNLRFLVHVYKLTGLQRLLANVSAYPLPFSRGGPRRRGPRY